MQYNATTLTLLSPGTLVYLPGKHLTDSSEYEYQIQSSSHYTEGLVATSQHRLDISSLHTSTGIIPPPPPPPLSLSLQ